MTALRQKNTAPRSLQAESGPPNAGPYAEVKAQLGGTHFTKILYREQTGSTNEDAALMLADPRAAGLTIVADFQSEGAGRSGRRWIAPPGTALLFTTILPVQVRSNDLWAVTFWAALAVRRAAAACNVSLALQWPNDLLLDEAKVAGLLCVSRVKGDDAHVGCGVGINVMRPPDAAEIGAIDPPPAFLSDHCVVERPQLLLEILRAFDTTLPFLQQPDEVRREWEREAGIPGMRYRMVRDDSADVIEGNALELATGGALVVQTAAGREEFTLARARVLRGSGA